MIYIVTYDLVGRGDYTPFYEALKKQGPWSHYLASTWLISTGKSPEEVMSAIRPYMNGQDLLLVAELGPRYQGFLPVQAWDWINTQRSNATALAAAKLAGAQSILGGSEVAPLRSLLGSSDTKKK
jgi:hypothetical protein